MSQEKREGAFAVATLLFAVLDKNSGVALLVVEAVDAKEAKQRADWVAPVFGWRHFDEDQLQQVAECPDRTPTFFADYFAAVDRGSDVTLH